MMGYQLLTAPKNYSSWSVRPWLVMRHFDIPFEEVVAPLFAEEGAKELILSWNAAGTVPVLRDGTLTIPDSLAIIEYLAEQHPDKPIWPKEASKRALARVVSAEMHASFMAVRNAMPMNVRARVEGLEFDEAVLSDIARIQHVWRTALEETNGPFLFGEFCAADAMYAPVISRFMTYGVALDEICRGYADAVMNVPASQEWVTISWTLLLVISLGISGPVTAWNCASAP